MYVILIWLVTELGWSGFIFSQLFYNLCFTRPTFVFYLANYVVFNFDHYVNKSSSNEFL